MTQEATLEPTWPIEMPTWPIEIMPSESPFLMGLHMLEAIGTFQMQWWDAWSGLLGQILPFEPQANDEQDSEVLLQVPPIGL